jgi:hypothetical protein
VTAVNASRINAIIRFHQAAYASAVEKRKLAMAKDANHHHFLYQMMGLSDLEAVELDVNQNNSRLLYRRLALCVEDLVWECFTAAQPDSLRHVIIPNVVGEKPANFEIDIVSANRGLEVKWRDATTDGDHVMKEKHRIISVAAAGYIPHRIMLCTPEREQARKIQERMRRIYAQNNGFFLAGDDAWSFIKQETGFNLKKCIDKMQR